jgi:hypothetical protein
MTKHHALQSGQRVAVLQSNYIPWKGYFDLIAAVDTFVIYDQMQYTREDWRNRNVIKTANGLTWLTVPVRQSGRFGQRICDTEISGNQWSRKHWKSIENSYRRAPYFEEIARLLLPIYEDANIIHLSVLNRRLIEVVCAYLGITTRLVDSSEVELTGERSERVAHVCKQLDARCYVSGPAASAYLNEADFVSRGISVEWFDYTGYPEYRQLWGAFAHQVSVLDLLFMCGPQAPSFMKFWDTSEVQARMNAL